MSNHRNHENFEDLLYPPNEVNHEPSNSAASNVAPNRHTAKRSGVGKTYFSRSTRGDFFRPALLDHSRFQHDTPTITSKKRFSINPPETFSDHLSEIFQPDVDSNDSLNNKDVTNSSSFQRFHSRSMNRWNHTGYSSSSLRVSGISRLAPGHIYESYRKETLHKVRATGSTAERVVKNTRAEQGRQSPTPNDFFHQQPLDDFVPNTGHCVKANASITSGIWA